MNLSPAQWRAIADDLRERFPEQYASVTGAPPWLDDFDPAHKRAQSKWLRFVKAQATKMEAAR